MDGHSTGMRLQQTLDQCFNSNKGILCQEESLLHVFLIVLNIYRDSHHTSAPNVSFMISRWFSIDHRCVMYIHLCQGCTCMQRVLSFRCFAPHRRSTCVSCSTTLSYATNLSANTELLVCFLGLSHKKYRIDIRLRHSKN